MKEVEQRPYDAEREARELDARESARRSRGGISLPMHIDPSDKSDAANSARYELHTRMMALNPNGWPTPPGGKPAHRKFARKAAGIAVGRAAQLGKMLMG